MAKTGLVSALGVVLAMGGIARANNYTITVDASKQSAGNPPFWAAAVGTGTASLTLRGDLESHYKIGNREAGFQRVRGHGVLSDAMGIYKGPGSYSWTNFDKYLTAITQAGMRPIMELDFMPTALALNGNDKDTYKNVTDYKNFIQAVVQHCVDWGSSHGVTDVSQWYWEIWNEPDYTGFWNGTNASEAMSAKMTDYYALYDAAVSAIIAVIPNAIVGGPVTTGPGPITAFLQHCKSAGTRVSFVSSHVYPGGASTGTSASANTLVSDNNTRVSDITAGGYSTSSVMSFNTEWNSSYNGQGGLTGDVVTSMDNHWNVGFILKGTKLLSDKNSGNTPPLSVFSYWVLSDVFDESSGPSGSYILGQSNGNLPFGRVFGLMTAQGVRKAAFNAFKMLNYLGPVRLLSAGTGTSNDGVDAMATMSSAGDSLQILTYDYYATVNTTGSDSVTVTVSNLPSGLSGKQVFVTQFVVDATHSNPYSVWTGQGSPTNPSESQWQAMKAAQHLALMQPVTTTTLSTSYSTTFTISRQAGSLLILSTKRPVTGRNGLGTIEGEDWDGQSSATKEDSNDADLGQSIVGQSGSYVFYDVVDFSDAGVGAVQMRVNAQSATNLEFHADSQTGTLLGKCAVSATTGWATQNCSLSSISGVHTLYVVFDGTVHLNWLQFQAASGGTGTGGSGGTTGAGGLSGSGGSSGSGGGTGSGGVSGSGGSGSGGSLVSGSGGAGSGGSGSGGSGSGGSGSGGSGSGGSGSGGSGSGGSGTGYGSGGSGNGTGTGGSSTATGGVAGCACSVGEVGGSAGNCCS